MSELTEDIKKCLEKHGFMLTCTNVSTKYHNSIFISTKGTMIKMNIEYTKVKLPVADIEVPNAPRLITDGFNGFRKG